MPSTLFKLIAASAGVATLGAHIALAQATLRITIPRRSRLTPVQRLNREGVEAVSKHDYSKAADLFYKAYLYDPADPFTLNNLGYVSELRGQLDRADTFYKLASEQGSNADIALSNVKGLEGKPMMAAFESIRTTAMQVNRMNVDAMQLLSKNRGFEAVGLLQRALKTEPENPFTLNNLGVAEEAVGDFGDALRYYNAAAESGSSEAVVVTRDAAWSGKPVSQTAAANAARLEELMRNGSTAALEAAMYNLRGVYAVDENDPEAAKADFLRAYSLDPTNAFSLNNRGYVAEMNGDLESAQFFYEKAQQAEGSGLHVGLATASSAQGRPLSQVATDSNEKVDGALSQYSQDRRLETGPIVLTPRGGASLANPPVTPEHQPPSNAPQSATPQPPHN
ncbi:MAG: tetratricopeptide repeat protein [Terracidiphilus sp.]